MVFVFGNGCSGVERDEIGLGVAFGCRVICGVDNASVGMRGIRDGSLADLVWLSFLGFVENKGPVGFVSQSCLGSSPELVRAGRGTPRSEQYFDFKDMGECCTGSMADSEIR